MGAEVQRAGERVLQREEAEERLQVPSARLSDALPTTAPVLEAAGATGPAEGSSHCKSVGRLEAAPLGARSSSPWPCGAGTGQVPRGQVDEAVRWAGLAAGHAAAAGEERQVHAAAFGGPVSGAEPRGRPRGGDMLTC